MGRERHRRQESFRGAWRGSDSASLSGVSRLSGLSRVCGLMNERDKTAPISTCQLRPYKPELIFLCISQLSFQLLMKRV
jgi:hypothetical protein